ncbi:Rv3235 family protein [Micromonospora sp. NBC_01813]|uniref:Rv3235 family protein n=1 Tax=Micromonospora sp. NBC_01813 TaxID=2975988 RepID=UPI002DD81A83|nr:Rv3235 family protein [Micromonospora sp. NBC_01813]WSA08459.1 Rv3235 family protein [Micromonospora sp. NBC_01813]
MPPLDPPFTDAPADFGVHPGVQLALDLSGPPSVEPARPPDDRSGTGHGGPAALPPDALAGASPDARQAAHRFLAASVEIINGFRPVSHGRRLTTPKQASAICVQLTAAVERVRTADRPPGGQRGRGPQPSRPGQPASARPGPPMRGDRRQELLRVRQLRICEPMAGVVETAAVLGTSSRSWALAFRLERQAGVWLGTAVQLI